MLEKDGAAMDDKKQPPFGFRDKLGYMFGDFGNDFTFILSTMLLMKFYSDVMGVSVALVGIMMMLARIVDAFTDVAMGQIADRSTGNAQGKFKPWILRMCVPVAFASLLIYANWLRDAPMIWKIIWMFFSYLLWGSVFYTAINIPYGSMASAISPDPGHRAELSNWRTIGASLAGTVLGAGLPLLVFKTDAMGNKVLSGSRVSLAATMCSVAAVICYLLCYRLVRERVTIPAVKKPFELRKLLFDLFHNRALLGIVVAATCMLVVQLSSQQMASYVYPNYFRNVFAQSVSGLVGVLVTLVMAAFTVRLSRRFGRKELAVVSSLFGGAVFFLTYLSQTRNVWLYLLFYSLSYVGLAVFSLISWAMITDVIDDTEVITGERSDGTIYAVYSFSRKLGQAIASGLAGTFLTLIGYSAQTQFDPAVTRGIYDLSCLIPAIGYLLLAILLLIFYPLNKKRVESNARMLQEKRRLEGLE